MSGRLQQRLRLLDVLVALRQACGKAGSACDGMSLPIDGVVVVGLLHHRVAVDDQPERLPDAVVVERRLVDAHHDRLEVAAVRGQQLQVRALADRRRLVEGNRVDRVDLAREQRVDLCGRIGQVDDHELVEVGLAATSSSSGSDELAALARGEALEHERARPDGFLRVEARGQDRELRHVPALGEDRVRRS